ncbi:helix-turn-helix transcriptional regulator [Streptomyces sp. SPB162]|uniref:helix-turn-helix domain-containing protein n=1 Tax=Streptomyces sp. SPB162 TaxID=2940560 RepID=UPI0024049A32|nr:helix-turn-helix transcriptional regulator [Streptomyces sp. SPB162]MDF9813120.1 transcriptional regulator with XRE-family HTH domain [Streptomyces sp. SPB162]
MAHRTFITARQRRLGAELRRMREHAGFTIQEAADLMGVTRSHITNTELARFGVSEDRLRALAANYSCSDGAYVDALVAMAAERKPGWWEDFRGILPAGALDLAELEHCAAALRVVQIMHVPGLLQTEEYARAVLSASVPSRSPAELRRTLSHRLRRREILDRDAPPPCVFIIHEAALRMRFGDQQVLRAQLAALLEASERENVTVRIVPFEAGGFHIAGLTVTYASGAVAQLDTVQLDTAHKALFLEAEAQLENHRAIFERTEKMALPVKKSRDFIRSIAHHM